MIIKRLAFLALLVSWTAAAAPMHEASTGFDLENVRPFLQRIAKQFESGFTDTVVRDLARFAAETPVEQTRKKTLSVTYRGKETQLVFQVFMDDVDAPDVYFFTPDASLAKMLQDEMVSFSEELGQ